MRRCVPVGVLLLAILALRASPVWAQTFPREPQTVYEGMVSDGHGYTKTFYPASVPTVYLMADVPNVLNARETQVYFWPLTGEYKPDWDLLNRPVTGTLEILQGDRVVATSDETRYAMTTPADALEPDRLIAGADADRAYEAYRKAMSLYTPAQEEYLKDYEAYQEAAAENIRLAQQGQPIRELVAPKPPTQPHPAVSEPAQGHLVKLPAGHYTMRMRDSGGQIVPGTVRAVEVVGPGRQGIGYGLRPESRWTQAVPAGEPGAVVYWGPDSLLYAQPYRELEFDEQAYTRIRSPQSVEGVGGRRVWIPVKSLENGQIELLAGGKVLAQVPITNYVVTQLPGTGLGYSISELPALLPKDMPSARLSTLRAARLDLSREPAPEAIRFVDENGQVLPLSERQVRRLRPLGPWATWIPPLLPLAAGALIILGRRRRTAESRR